MTSLVISYVLISAGAFLVGSGIRYYYLGNLFGKWQEYRGAITKSTVSKATDSDLNEVSFAAIEYEFRVEGVTIKASRIRFGIPTNSRALTEKMTNRYPSGKAVIVFYDPVSKRSILEKGVTDGTYFLFFLGILAFVLAATVVMK